MISRHATPSLLFAALLLAGCSFADKSEPRPAAASAQGCDADAVQGLIGQTASPDLLEQARQRAGAQTARVIGPHDNITLDYNSRRLNLEVDERLTIGQIHCG